MYSSNHSRSRQHEQLLALASGSSIGVRSYPGCVVNGVKFLTYTRDINRSTQNSGIYVQDSDNQQYYGILEEIYQVPYTGDNFVILFKCKWFNTNPDSRNVRDYKGRISIRTNVIWYQNEPFILASQAEQVFYVDDLYNGNDWKVIEHFRHRNIWDLPTTDYEDDQEVEDISNERIQLHVELPDIDMITYAQSDMPSQAVTSDVESLIRSDVIPEDDFINDDDDNKSDDETDMIMYEENDEMDDDINDVESNQDDSD